MPQTEHQLLTQLDTIVKRLEADRETQQIPLEELATLEADAKHIQTKLLQLYTGKTKPVDETMTF